MNCIEDKIKKLLRMKRGGTDAAAAKWRGYLAGRAIELRPAVTSATEGRLMLV